VHFAAVVVPVADSGGENLADGADVSPSRTRAITGFHWLAMRDPDEMAS
jgi:hypothetical protein